jgi:hypothetical protein
MVLSEAPGLADDPQALCFPLALTSTTAASPPLACSRRGPLFCESKTPTLHEFHIDCLDSPIVSSLLQRLLQSGPIEVDSDLAIDLAELLIVLERGLDSALAESGVL